MTIEGKGLFTIDGQEFPATKNDLIHCIDQEQLSFKNDSAEPASLYVVLNKTQTAEK